MKTPRGPLRKIVFLLTTGLLWAQAGSAGAAGLVLAPASGSSLGLVLAPAIREARADQSRALPDSATRYDALIQQAAQTYGHEADLLRAIVRVESGFNPDAVSSKGAIGLMQVMPATAADLGLSDARHALFDPVTNLDVGARYLRRLARRFDGDLELMIAAYNAGENAVSRYNNAIPPFAQTQDYVRAVLATYHRLQAGR